MAFKTDKIAIIKAQNKRVLIGTVCIKCKTPFYTVVVQVKATECSKKH